MSRISSIQTQKSINLIKQARIHIFTHSNLPTTQTFTNMKLSTIMIPLAFGLAAADTLSVDFHDQKCEDPAFQSFTIGTINLCHNVEREFQVYTQHDIGQGLFGRNLGLRIFRDFNCQGPSATGSLSNVRDCVAAEGRSFMLTSTLPSP